MRPVRAVRALLALLLAGLLAAPALVAGSTGAAAHPGGAVLFYRPSTFEGSPEVRAARALGFRPVLANRTEWAALTPAQVRSYRAVVFGDLLCERDAGVLDTAVRTRATWAPSVDAGNHVLLGTDPSWQVLEDGIAAGEVLWRTSIGFATAGRSTGLVVSLSCMYTSAQPGTPVPLLRPFGDFRVRGTLGPPFPECPTTARVVSPRHPVVRALTSADMSGWTCSPHEVFTRFPSSYRAVVTSWGFPFVLARTG